ncbi:MAG: permease [Proteobacteria bacterium]|nr:permease [Pseudomonadota bacterium]
MRRKNNMFASTVVFAVLSAVLLYVGYSRGKGEHIAGLKAAFTILWQILPMLILAFIVAGMIQVLIPRELIARWIGEESGIRGILVGSLAGGMTPGGPYVSLPLVAGFLSAGASLGTMVSYVTGWSVYAVARLPLEVGILGWRFTLVRLACTFFVPPLAGFLAHVIFRK